MNLNEISRWWVGKFGGDMARAERGMMVVIALEFLLLFWSVKR